MSKVPIPLRVLVLEDCASDTALLLAHLRHAGYEPRWRCVDAAQTFRAALTDGTWDVILADYSMPQFTAPDALAILKHYQIDVPFIIVSGSVGEPAAVQAMKSGAHDFFLKDNLVRLASAVERERDYARVRAERREAIHALRESQKRLRDSVRARDESLVVASNELKEPLTLLNGEVESARQLLLDWGAAAGRPETFEAKLVRMSLHIARLAKMIDDLPSVTKLASGQVELARETFDLQDAVDRPSPVQ